MAVPGQQVDQPPLHITAADLLPAGVAGAGDQVGGGEPRHGLGVGPHRLGGLTLGGQVQLDGSISGENTPASSGLRRRGRGCGTVIVFLSPAVPLRRTHPRLSVSGEVRESREEAH